MAARLVVYKYSMITQIESDVIAHALHNLFLLYVHINKTNEIYLVEISRLYISCQSTNPLLPEIYTKAKNLKLIGYCHMTASLSTGTLLIGSSSIPLTIKRPFICVANIPQEEVNWHCMAV